jgi:hypothetical protein
MAPQLATFELVAPLFIGGLFFLVFIMFMGAFVGALRNFIDWISGG